MRKITIYHNPRCSKSREALQFLLDKQLRPTIIEYLKTPPSPAEIKQLLKQLMISPRELMRKKESIYKELALDDSSLTEQQLIKALADNPMLIERPIVVVNDRAVVARPAEKVLELLQ